MGSVQVPLQQGNQRTLPPTNSPSPKKGIKRPRSPVETIEISSDDGSVVALEGPPVTSNVAVAHDGSDIVASPDAKRGR